MRLVALFFLVGIIGFSCENDEKASGDSSSEGNTESSVEEKVKSKSDIDEDIETLLVRRWKFNERTSASDEESMKFGDESSDVILRLEPNGFFMIYDSITNERIIEKGLKRIEQRSSGQWDLIDEEVLILRKITSDTIIIDSLRIEKLDKINLVTETKNNNRITYFSID